MGAPTKHEPPAGTGMQSSFPTKSHRPKGDTRTGVPADQQASSTVTYATGRRVGCRLNVPTDLMKDGAGTMTRAEYDAWEVDR